MNCLGSASIIQPTKRSSVKRAPGKAIVVPFVGVVALLMMSHVAMAGLVAAEGTSSAVGVIHVFEAESCARLGKAPKIKDQSASGRRAVGLFQPGQGLRLSRVPAASKLAIRYATTNVGTISVAVNDRTVQKVNVHSTGAFTNSYLWAIITLPIPEKATLTIYLVSNDVLITVDRMIIGDGDLGLPPDIWNLPPLPIAPGLYGPDWYRLAQQYQAPQWWREAKFGAWSHWTPQSMPECSDWYARGMYQEGHWQYYHHVRNFDRPSEYGYKDICHNWVIDKWNPEELMDLYIDMGARYFMAMGVHHDNFDCWDSTYQPWNSVRVGPKVDIVGTWEKVARKRGMRFGIGFHNTPPRTWGQFMPVRYTSDKKGPKKGVPYDALQTVLDGRGKWWEGLDPVDLYGPVHSADDDSLRSPYANQFMWRVHDAISKYRPDFIYFDEAAGNTLIDLGVRMGLGFLAPQLVAHFYNMSLPWNTGKMDVVINLKCIGGRYNSFKNNPELVPVVERALVKSMEADVEPQITPYPFQTEVTNGDWHYRRGQQYMNAWEVVRLLMQIVSRNGSMLLNLSQRGRGDIDPELMQIAKDVGAWLRLNGEAIYGSRPFEVCSEESLPVCYTRNNGRVYAILLDWDGGPITLKALRPGGATLGNVTAVELLGSDTTIRFVQNEHGLTVTPTAQVPVIGKMADTNLAARARVLRITHDKPWFNDDDPGASYPGWIRKCNLGTGDYNNDLTISETPGTVWSCRFEGRGVKVIAPTEPVAGKIEIRIDDVMRGVAGLSNSSGRRPQQVVFSAQDLPLGEHTISIINRGPGPVAVDALVFE